MASENIKELDSNSFDATINSGDKPVLVDFWAPWCGPCKAIAPLLDEVADEMANDVVIGKVNVDDNSDLATKFGIRAIPTMILFKGGNKVDEIVGMATKEDIQSKIKAAS